MAHPFPDPRGQRAPSPYNARGGPPLGRPRENPLPISPRDPPPRGGGPSRGRGRGQPGVVTPWTIMQQQQRPQPGQQRLLNERSGPIDVAREERAFLADQILIAIKEEKYVTQEGAEYNISQHNAWLLQQTQYFAPGFEQLQRWMDRPPINPALAIKGQPPEIPRGQKHTIVHFEPQSTLMVARHWAMQGENLRVGVLNFASATKPGGGFKSGAQAQEESLARASNLYVSLGSQEASSFYNLHLKDKKGGYYTHAMIYSGGVALMRDDSGLFTAPVPVNMVTSAAVNAGVVHQSAAKGGYNPEVVDQSIRAEMYERMGRILRLFEEKGDTILVLGSFGTGVFQNSISMVAATWAQLLGPGGRFRGVFDHIIFAILGDATYMEFKEAFGGALGELQRAKQSQSVPSGSGQSLL